jgi:hypothetical protein
LHELTPMEAQLAHLKAGIVRHPEVEVRPFVT